MDDKKKTLTYRLGYFGAFVIYYSIVSVVLAIAIKLIFMIFGI